MNVIAPALSPANIRHLEDYMPIAILQAPCHCKDLGQNLNCEVTLQYNYSLTSIHMMESLADSKTSVIFPLSQFSVLSIPE
ncbi:unnamed protein product [Macrosiphum euphorbiae]|uniref:Uncharacterized protein n=1 Tax=Macrosiphum euphorbiae TaxID=13131 RepID=A0AAV0W477_9HEMI|nr:unnamed protein product [Macrosiphum euphorbiae]